MKDNEYTLPLYAKVTISLVGLFLIVTLLYIAKGIIMPLVFATIIAIVLNPVVNKLVKIKINRIIAITITLLLTILVIFGVGTILFSQASQFGESWPKLVEKSTDVINRTIVWASGYFNINPQKIHDGITANLKELINASKSTIGPTIVSLGSGIIVMFLIPVYIFLLLFYQPLLLDFIKKLFGKDNEQQVSKVVTQTKSLIQHYLIGLLIEALIVGTLYTITLLILGVDYAILLGLIGAMINVIPYVGGLVGVLLPMMVALATKSTVLPAFYILGIYYVIQMIDNHYIVPAIVASKVKINALFSIIVVIAGNALWGIPGMFLSIPILAIIKLIFDNIDSLKPWGFLLGDTMPPVLNIKPILKKIKTKLK